jgi:dihydroflavonol-4-reductase
MKVLITGISGLLGSMIARDAHMAGYEVVGVSRNDSKLNFNFPVKMEVLDLTEYPLKQSMLSDIDIVIHCAANTSMGSLDNPNQNQLNTESVRNLIELSLKAKVSKFILISTANTFVPGDKQRPGNEANKLEISPSNLNYINSKIKAEQILQYAVQNFGLNGIIVNPTFILNPLASFRSSNKLLKYCLNKSILFYPKGGKNIVDARDVSKAIIATIERGKIGENYIISNKNYTYKEFYKITLKEQKRKAVLIPLPAWLLLLFGGISTIIERLFRKPINFNMNTAKLLNSNHYYDYSKAETNLNFNPRTIQDTIRTKLNNFKP